MSLIRVLFPPVAVYADRFFNVALPVVNLNPLLDGAASTRVIVPASDPLEVVPAGSFDEVIATARRLARPGDAVLLSPACSSYDMFKNYEERGERFRKAVEAL